MDKNKIAKIKSVKRRLSALRKRIEFFRDVIRRCVPSTDDTGFLAEVAILNAQRIDLDLELDNLLRTAD